MDSPLTARLCTIIGRNLTQESDVGHRVLGWQGNAGGWADGLPLRLCGGLHALVRQGVAPGLAGCYPPNPLPSEELLWQTVSKALHEHGPALLPWLDHPPQTNEVGRAAALMSGLLAASAEYRLPIHLYELGASAGLNLILDRYGYELGGVRAGDATSPLQLMPEWPGPPPPTAEVRVAHRRGVDLRPLDLAADGERLLAFVWPDQQQRLAQLETALEIARKEPPAIDTADAADWLEAKLSLDPEVGAARIVLHSVAYQYFPASSQSRIAEHIAAAGAGASADAPLHWLRFEKEAEDRETSLRLASYPSGEDRLLAYCHPHGRWIRWCSD